MREHVFCPDGKDIWHMPFAWAAASGDGKDEFDVARVNLLMTKNVIRPGKPARAQGLTELSAHASMRRRQRPIGFAGLAGDASR
jgi:hypothetical protein